MLLQLLMVLVAAVKLWPKPHHKHVGYITADGAVLCPSPDNLRLRIAEPRLMNSLGCRKLPRGTPVLRSDDPTLTTPRTWKVYLFNRIDSGDPERGWGRREDFLMPDGSAVTDGPQA